MLYDIPDSNVHEANMWPIWGRKDPGGPNVGPMNFAIWDILNCELGAGRDSSKFKPAFSVTECKIAL